MDGYVFEKYFLTKKLIRNKQTTQEVSMKRFKWSIILGMSLISFSILTALRHQLSDLRGF